MLLGPHTEQQRNECISFAATRLPGQSDCLLTATSCSHAHKHKRPNGIGLGWGGYDEFIDWQSHGRMLKKELVPENPADNNAQKDIKFISSSALTNININPHMFTKLVAYPVPTLHQKLCLARKARVQGISQGAMRARGGA